MRVILTAILLMLAALATSPARAWGPDGHRIICAIAWDEVTPKTRARLIDILHVGTREAFADSCNWADEQVPSHPETRPWHFINMPPEAITVDLARDCSAAASCVLAQIGIRADALAVGAPGTADHLRFLTHFVGDIHMPLHASFARDRGGNDLKGLYFGKPTNLHLLWDVDMIARDGRPWPEVADDLRSQIGRAEYMSLAMAIPETWANESLALARSPSTGYLVHGGTFELDEDYTRINLPIALQRMKAAAIRLAVLLNDVLAETRVTSVP